MCPVEEIGNHSVIPSTIPNKIAFNISNILSTPIKLYHNYHIYMISLQIFFLLLHISVNL